MANENQQQEAKEKLTVVTLSKEASEKIDNWFEQISQKKKVKISKRAFVNWFIESANDNLSSSEISAAIEKFYDAEAHLKQMLREVKKAKKDGVSSKSIDVIVKEKRAESKKEVIKSDDKIFEV